MALNFPLIASMAPQIPQKKPDWRASLFDRLMPDGDGLDDGDKEAAMRQGLLGLASGLLGTGGGFGNALSAGIQNGLLATNQSVDSQQDRQYRRQMMERQTGDPAGFREADMIAKAAGLQPGTTEYQHFMKVQGGVAPREVGAAAKPQTYTGRDGKPRQGFFEPNSRQFYVMDDQGGWVIADPSGFVPAGPSMGAPAPGPAPRQAPMGGGPLNPEQDFGALTSQFGIQPSSTLRTPERNAAVGGVPNSFHLTGEAADYPVPQEQKPQFIAQARSMGYQAIDEGDHVHVEPPRRGMTSPSAARLFGGRSAEEEAAAVEVAKIDANLGRGAAVTAMEADRAGQIEEAKLSAQLAGDKAAAMPKRKLAIQQMSNKAENLNHALASAIPSINVWTAGTVGKPLASLSGSDAADLRANLDTIEAIVAFDELQQMRASSPTGGALGSVTERELNLLASTIANVKQSQSPEQLRKNLAFLGQQYNKVVQQMQADFEADSRMGGQAATGPADPLGIL